MTPLLLSLFAAPAEPPVSFLADVAPVLRDNCFACHNGKKASGRYDMTTAEKLLAGGSNGPGIVPGKPGEGEFHALLVTDEERRMPPRDKGTAVPAAQAATIARWIAGGAVIDPGLDPTADLTRELRKRWTPPEPPPTYTVPPVVRALAFTPDGSRLVVSGYHELLVYDVASHQLVARLRTRAERAHALAFLPDGRLAVAGGRPGLAGDVRVYNLTVPRRSDGVTRLNGVNDPAVLTATLLETDDEVLALAVSADGTRLAAGGTDRATRVWDTRGQFELLQTVENHADWVQSVAFSPDGSRLFTASRDRTAKVWDLAVRKAVVTFPDHREAVTGVVASADGRFGYSVGADKLLRQWEATGEGKQVRVVGSHAAAVTRLVLAPGGTRLLTAAADGTVKSWASGHERSDVTFAGPSGPARALAASADGRLVAVGGHAGEVWLWRVDKPDESIRFSARP